MATTSGYQAGVETNATQLSYGVEVTWGTAPAIQFQAIRYTSETLALNKTRNRPAEINSTREASQGVTTQQVAQGSINYAFSWQTYDDFISCVLQADWQASVPIASIAGDITITTGTNVLSSTLGTKFTAILAGTWIRLFGFTNSVNNGLFYVTTKTDNSHLVLSGNPSAFVTETPSGTAAQVRYGNIRNSNAFRSLWIQQQFSPSLFLEYAGSYVSRWTMTGGIGNFPTGAFDIIAKSEASAVSNASTGAVLAATTGRVFDPVAGWITATFNEVAVATAIDQFSLTVENTGAAGEFAMGSAGLAGMLGGMLTVTGSFRAYFKDFTLYTNFANETSGRLAFQIRDNLGNAYIITILNAIMLINVDAGGPNVPVYATVNLEGGPAAGGGTIMVDRLPVT